MTRINSHIIGASRRLPPRITMLASSPKYKQKEERKRVLKLCVKKLRSIEDPEAFLSRSVLINNTLKRLQSEVREEKAEKKMVTYSPSPYSFYAIEKAYREEMEKHEEEAVTLVEEDQTMFEADDEAEETSASSSSEDDNSSSSSSEDEEDKSVSPQVEAAPPMTSVVSRSLEDDLLSEVYMPPPQLIASIDEEDEAMAIKRPATPVPWAVNTNNNPSAEAVIKSSECCDNEADSIWSEAVRTECWTKPANPVTVAVTSKTSWPQLDWPTYTPSTASMDSSMSSTTASSASDFNPNICVPTGSCHPTPTSSNANKENIVSSYPEKCYSCGQSSLFQSELQSVVFNSLIASLET